ncbi:hypothetical protein AB0N54_01780, partial [Streptomyces clavifer]
MRNTVFTIAGIVTTAVLTLGAGNAAAAAATTDGTARVLVAAAHLLTDGGEGPNVAPTSGEGPNV